jgi:hypothetical protein
VRNAAVDDEHAVHAPFDGAAAAFRLRDHAALNDAAGNKLRQFIDPDGREERRRIVLVLEDPGDIRHGDETLRAKSARNACGGGIGVAPVYPIARAYHELGNKVISIVGARSKDLIIWRDKMQAISDELIITTDDGSEGHKGFVTDPLREMLEKGEKIDLVLAIGPVIMMKNVAATTKPFGTKTTVSLNTIMVDGTGMCGGCRVMVGNENKFACVDGPEFDGHLVDFANLMQRQMMYKDQESIEYSCGGHCKCVEE